MMQHIEKTIYGEISKIDIRLKPKEYTGEILHAICRNLGYQFGSIILLDEGGKGNIFSAYNLPSTYAERVHRVREPVLSSPSGEAIKTGQVVVINDIIADTRLKPWWDLLLQVEIKNIVWVPLFSKGEAFGTYNLYDRHNHDVAEEEKITLYQLSMLISLAIVSNEYIDKIQEKTRELELEIKERQKVERELRAAMARAEAADKAKREFLANMSHEIRTPLNAILGFSNLILGEETDESRRENLEIVRDAGENLLIVINDVLDFVNIGTGRLELENSEFSLKDLLHRMTHIFYLSAAEKCLGFTLKIDDAVPSLVLGDKNRVNQIVFNIVSNALKFTEKGSVEVDCTYREGIASIRVSDTGIGISKEKQETIFAAFTQADSSLTREYGGLGLGLAIAGRLIDRMSGEITLESQPGLGSTFIVRLPLPKSDRLPVNA